MGLKNKKKQQDFKGSPAVFIVLRIYLLHFPEEVVSAGGTEVVSVGVTEVVSVVGV